MSAHKITRQSPSLKFTSMFTLKVWSLVLSLCVAGALAAPTGNATAHLDLVLNRRTETELSSSEINSYATYTWYASTAYCKPANTLAWNCGKNCNSNSDFKPVASGGDGSATNYWYVGYDPSLNAVIVAHQGSDFSKIWSWIHDGSVVREKLDSTLFPGISSSIAVHSGFKGAQERSATAVLAAVKKTLSKYPSATRVVTVGHSLGAAIALIDAVYLKLHLSSSLSIQTYAYGMPRVGEQDWANYVDAHISVKRITNKKDPVPILPGRGLGYRHPSGEKHIDAQTSKWYACSGQENESGLCEIGDLPSLLDGYSTANHGGPYGPVTMGC